MIRCTVLAAVLAAAAASETDATQNELRRASEARAREAAYQQQAYAPNLGSGGIDVQAAGQRLVDQIRASEQADAAERAASAERSRQELAAAADRRAAESYLQSLFNHRDRMAVETAWWQRMVGDFNAMCKTPAAERDARAWRRTCACRVALWERSAWFGDKNAQDGESVAWNKAQTMIVLRQAAASGLDEAVVACAVLDLRDHVAVAEVAATLDRHIGASPEQAPASAVLAACLAADLRIPEEGDLLAVVGDLFRSESYLVSRLAGGLAARVLDGPALSDPQRGRIAGLLRGVERGGSPGLAMCARTALIRLEPAAPRRSLASIWSVPDGHPGEAFREWAFLDQFLTGLAAAGLGDVGPLDQLAADLAANPQFLPSQPLAGLAWKQLRREATGWRVEDGELAGLLLPLKNHASNLNLWPPTKALDMLRGLRPGDPWAAEGSGPLKWLPASRIVALGKSRAKVVQKPSTRLDFGNLSPEDRVGTATATLPAEIPYLPGDQVGTGLSPLTWSWIQERLAVQALATARTPGLPAQHARVATALTGQILLTSSGSFAGLNGFDGLDMEEPLRCRARASMMLGAAIEIGVFSTLPDLPWTLAPDTAVWHHIDAAMMGLLWLDKVRSRKPPMSVTDDWLVRLALRLARRDMDDASVPRERWWVMANRFILSLPVNDFQHLAPRLAEACLAAGLPMDAQARGILERQAAWWRDRDR